MIVPPRDENGMPDLASINTWNVGCDNPGCDAEAPMSNCSRWLIGRSTTYRVYCPRCEKRTARQMIRSALGPTLPRFISALWRSL
jgi:hypothetical protein